ncbi:myosin-11 [Calliphora vicina]|uniref:myosin-11 n=1 Tax=Calliphora vicina TaxID=7373 RepID=UPI00325B58B9
MGGCRCNFRNCHVGNAKFERMHFFRFPLKDSVRYKKWRLYANMEHMVDFSEVRRKNTSICARHFRPECFMNYRMDRLAPNAIPTLMRLSKDQALDYELDIENGILVRLEQTKFKHLIPPNNFQCPLYLEDDNILFEKLNEVQRQQYCENVPGDMEYEVSDNTVEYEEVIMENPEKPLVNSVEILETIQVTAPNSKRAREISDDEGQHAGASVNNKKCRILNITNYVAANEMQDVSAVVLASESIQRDSCELVNSDDIHFVEEDEIENIHELVNDDGNLLLTDDDFINTNNVEAEDDEIEFVEVHKDDENNLHYDLSSKDPDSTIVQLKTYKTRTSVSEAISGQLEIVQNELAELKKSSQDCTILQAKLSILETENAKLNETCKENEQIKTRLLSLQKENNSIRRTLNENKNISDKLQEYCEENRKLKEQAASFECIKAKLIFREQETKELKKLLESFKDYETKEQNLKQLNLELENVRSNNLANEMKLKDEITHLKRKLESTQQQLEFTETELKEVKTDLNSMKNEKDRHIQRHEELQQSLDRIQNNFDDKQNDYRILKTEHDSVQQKFIVLEQKYWKLQALQNQEATVSTSLENNNKKSTSQPPPISSNSLTKAQLFNGIKRYISASMVSLLRMEMFGNSEREWKPDERQVATDILRLGETVYKYFTDEWRFRLPGLRDVRNWLSQSQELMDDEEDL